MKPLISCVIVLFLFLGTGLLGSNLFAKGVECEVDNTALRAMPKAIVSFTRADESEFEIEVKLADNNMTRAAGFQRVCASTIAAEPILFVFASERQPSQAKFHMNNVVAPIDIAFIDKSGIIDSVQAMQPYSLIRTDKPLYSPKRPAIAALESHPGFFSEHRLGPDTVVSWRSID